MSELRAADCGCGLPVVGNIWLGHVREYPNQFICACVRLFCGYRPKMAGGLISFLFLFVAASSANKVEDEGQCRTYAGGDVYPERQKTPEHALHWSKAQSKFVSSCTCWLISKYLYEQSDFVVWKSHVNCYENLFVISSNIKKNNQSRSEFLW